MYCTGHLGLSLRRCPRLLLASALAVYLTHGLGLFVGGARGYFGRAWQDQFNYTVLAQSLIDLPFSTPIEDLEYQPALLPVHWLKEERLGQSVLQAFFAVSSGTTARLLFEPTILLAPALVVLAVVALCRRLGLAPRQALATAVTAGLLPALAQVHLEGFLSQALATPFLLLLPALLYDVGRRPGVRTLGPAALLLTTLTAVYTEMWPIFIAIVVLVLALSALRTLRARGGQKSQPLLVCGVVLLTAPFLLIPRLLPSMRIVFGHLGVIQLNHLFPWGLQVEGLVRLWLGDLATVNLPPPASWMGDRGAPPMGQIPAQVLVRCFGLAATGLGLFGLARTWRDSFRRRSFALVSGLLGLALTPLVVLACGDQYAYQFYKLLLTVSPLLVVGLGLLSPPWRQVCNLPILQRYIGNVPRLLAPVGVAALTGTALMTYQPARLKLTPRSFAGYVQTPDLLELQERLEQLAGENVFIGYRDDTTPCSHLINGWLAFAARQNRVWLGSITINDLSIASVPNASGSVDLTRLPRELIVLTGRGCLPQAADLSGGQLLWSNRSYQLWKVSSGLRLAVVSGVTDGHGLNGSSVPSSFLIWPDSATLTIRATHAGCGVLSGDVELFAAAGGTTCRVRVENPALGHCQTVALKAGHQRVEVPLAAGTNTITLTPTAPFARGSPVLGVTGLQVRLRPKASREQASRER
jgi:hypothetical protein